MRSMLAAVKKRYLLGPVMVLALGFGLSACTPLFSSNAMHGASAIPSGSTVPSIKAASGSGQQSASSRGSVEAVSLSKEARAQEFQEQLADLVRQLTAKHGEKIGIAVSTPEGDFRAGLSGSGPAWSTMKVPIAIAALRAGAPKYLVDEAIVSSDNDAAYALWLHIKNTQKDPTGYIDGVLKEGDSSARWQPADIYGDVSFGYARWLLVDQARFAAHYPCVQDHEYVFDAMDNIVSWQRYGLVSLTGAHAKGGWGYDEESGLYTQRQFGAVDVDGALIGVAITAVRSDMEELGEEGIVEKTVDTVEDGAQKLVKLIHEAMATGKITGFSWEEEACPV